MITTMKPPVTSRFKRRAYWRQQLVDAESGLRLGLRTDSHLAFYFFSFTVVLAAGIAVGLNVAEWAIVVLSMTSVLSAQMLRQMVIAAFERIGEASSMNLGPVQRFAAAAVAIPSIGATLATALVIAHRLLESWPQ